MSRIPLHALHVLTIAACFWIASVARAADTCEGHGPSLEVRKGVAVRLDTPVRTGPGAKLPRVVNEKATAIFKRTEYVDVGGYELTELCRLEKWSRVTMNNPSLPGHVGWVQATKLRVVQYKNGKRILHEDEFFWGKSTRAHKATIIAGANLIFQTHPRCKEIEPATAELSATRSKPRKPVFFVTCYSDSGQSVVSAFNVWFTPQDVKAQKSFAQ